MTEPVLVDMDMHVDGGAIVRTHVLLCVHAAQQTEADAVDNIVRLLGRGLCWRGTHGRLSGCSHKMVQCHATMTT